MIYDLAADPSAQSWSTGGRLGYLLDDGPVQIGPTIGLDYATAHVNGYTEANDLAASLTVNSQSSSTLIGSAGIETRISGLGRFEPWFRLSAEKDFLGDGRTITYAPTDAPGIVNSFRIEDTSRSPYGAFTGGIVAAVYGPLSIELDGQATFFRSTGNQASGVLELNVHL